MLGLGLRELSVAPGEMLEVKDRIRNTDLAEARELARAALALGSATEIEALLGRREEQLPRPSSSQRLTGTSAIAPAGHAGRR